MREARTIHNYLPMQCQETENQDERLAGTFSHLVMDGKINAALRYLSDNFQGGVLSLNHAEPDGPTVREILREKHPSPREVNGEALLTGNVTSVHPVLFESITGDAICAAALRTQGAAGPSGVDAAGWRRLLTSFHRHSTDLCSAIASVARRLCTEYVDPEGLQAFIACRLIPLSKNPGVRPIGVCEVIRRIVGKAVMRTVGPDVLNATGSVQLCAGHEAVCEAAVHAMRTVFEDASTDAILLVDASNAFNNLNRRVALLNIQVLCPAVATILINCYRGNALLVVKDEFMYSKEGITQGDPLAMAMFALASVPLIRRIDTDGAIQAWYADDASSGGLLACIRKWWDQLTMYGPQYGYFPNAVKTWLIVKEDKHAEAVQLFEETGVKITTTGQRYLGGAIGKEVFVSSYISEKIMQWAGEVRQLAKFAKSQPHAAFAAFSNGLIGKWTYLTRVVQISEQLMQPLEDEISQSLVPALTGQAPLNDQIRKLCALPARHGGLGIINPTELTNRQYDMSRAICKPLVEQILKKSGDPSLAKLEQQQLKKKYKQQQRLEKKDTAAALTEELSPSLQRSVLAASEKGASTWLTALPIEQHGFALHKGAFRDALALRYGWPLSQTPATCACGSKFEIDHMLTCKAGGYISLRHNELRDMTAGLLREVCKDVCTEPTLQPVGGEVLPRSANTSREARLDIRARGFWDNRWQEAFFDIRVFHHSASSYLHTPIATVYKQHEDKKRREYGSRVREIEHGCFTPLVFSTAGGIGREGTVFFKRLASLISDERKEPYSLVLGWIRQRISFPLLRSALFCLRGSRHLRRDIEKEQSSITLAMAESQSMMI